jgi:hypothetical protein
MGKLKHSTKKRITLKVWDKEIIAQIYYPKHSRLKTRLKVLEELRGELYK